MAGRMSLRILRQAKSRLSLESPLELSACSVFRALRLDSATGCAVQASNESIHFHPCIHRFAGIHGARRLESAPQPTYGVGPHIGDPSLKGDTPEDFRAAELREVEPKEVTKEAAAAQAMDEPPDYQINKAVPEESKPIEHDAVPQRDDEEKAFDDDTRELKGTARYQGETTGTEKGGDEVEAQYGAGPDEGKTTRS